MADTAKIILVKKFTYRGVDEEWSNVYHLSANPATSWTHTAQLIRGEEKKILPNSVHYLRAYCYNVAPEVKGRVVTEVVDLSGTSGLLNYDDASADPTPGDAAFVVEWGTAVFTSKGKRIYLRKYFHGAFTPENASADDLYFDQSAKADAFAIAAMVSGAFDAGDFVGPRGAHPISHKTLPHITTRTLKRRGKRPPA